VGGREDQTHPFPSQGELVSELDSLVEKRSIRFAGELVRAEDSGQITNGSLEHADGVTGLGVRKVNLFREVDASTEVGL
jgi:hypothetical protein